MRGWPGSGLGLGRGEQPCLPSSLAAHVAPVASPPRARWNLGPWEPQARVLTLSGGLTSRADTGELDSLGVQDPQGGMEPGWGPARTLRGARWGGGVAQVPVLVRGLCPTSWHSWWYLCLFTASSA